MVFGNFGRLEACYFIGIGGVSMSALALLLHDGGVRVRGSDAQESDLTRRLRGRGIPVSIGDGEEIGEETVVYTGAIPPGHRQFSAAVKAGKRLIGRAELLGLVATRYQKTAAIAGCHGKTTTSCMLAHICAAGGRKFACHIGGEDLDFGNYVSTGDDLFVTEACEFRRSFLHLFADVAVVLNCDRDHTDCYATKEELLSAYRAFAAQGKRVVVNADDVSARSIPHTLSFGLCAGDVRAERLRSVGEKYSFTVTEGGIPVVRIRLKIIGKVNVLNALAAYASARLLGFSAEEIKRGLETFRGVKRRYERVGTICGAPVVCDYAHHPREIAATFSTAQKLCEGTVRLVFQPHTYTRTRDLMDGFVGALSRAERPILFATYAAREGFIWEGSAAYLASKISGARYVRTAEHLKKCLHACVQEGDVVLVLGAGDIYDTVKGILDGAAESQSGKTAS